MTHCRRTPKIIAKCLKRNRQMHWSIGMKKFPDAISLNPLSPKLVKLHSLHSNAIYSLLTVRLSFAQNCISSRKLFLSHCKPYLFVLTCLLIFSTLLLKLLKRDQKFVFRRSARSKMYGGPINLCDGAVPAVAAPAQTQRCSCVKERKCHPWTLLGWSPFGDFFLVRSMI